MIWKRTKAIYVVVLILKAIDRLSIDISEVKE